MRCFTVSPRQSSKAVLEVVLLNQVCEGIRYQKRPFIIICPGGGYGMCGDRDSEPIALAYMGAGFHTGVLRYSIRPTPQDPVVGDEPMRDVEAAVRYVRSHADEWGIDENKIILEGDSAGSHVAACEAVLWDHEDRIPGGSDGMGRPNAMILGYSVITANEWSHRWSIGNLSGNSELCEQDVELYSVEKYVSADTCPAFIWHSVRDADVPVENSFILANALRRNGVPFALHLFASGWHGLSLGTGEVGGVDKHASRWFSLSVDWLREMGLGPVFQS